MSLIWEGNDRKPQQLPAEERIARWTTAMLLCIIIAGIAVSYVIISRWS